MSLIPGSRLGPYEIIAPLGVGGMGEVYRARDARLQRDVAIKMLPASFASDADRLHRFEQEARTASALNHPNVLSIYDIGNVAGTLYIASELVPGETLRARLERGPMPIDELYAVAGQTVAALAAAHDAGIVHRDLKPENVVIRPDGLVKLLDFGLAKLCGAIERNENAVTIAPAETALGVVAGTVKYMSPEQARGQIVDARSDVFSFGVLLYEMLTGRVPHDGPTSTDVMVAILERPPAPVTTHRRDAPADLQAVIARCLEKMPDRRYGSAREVAIALSPKSGTPALAQAVASDVPSIAVLPFANMSADSENEYFCDGLAEELIDRLTRIEGLRVAARTSAFAFKGKRSDIREIGRALNVRTVLDGSVRKAGPRIRVTAQLVNVADGFHLWSEKYDRDLDDIFAIQDHIAEAIVEALKVRLGPGTGARGARRRENAEAYNLYLKGRFCRNKVTPEAFREGIRHYEQALQKDPEYALAFAGLAEIYALTVMLGWVAPDSGWPKAQQAAASALQLDETLAAAHAVLGTVRWVYDRDWIGAERAFSRAIQEEPAYSISYERYGFFLICLQRMDEGVRVLKTMRDLDPLSSVANALYGCGLWYAHRYDEAIAQLKVSLSIEADQVWAHWGLGLSYEQKGAYTDAIAALETACALGGPAQAWLAHAYARAGRRADAIRFLHELTTRANETYVPAYEFALVYVGLGEWDSALEWLEKAIEDRNVWTLHCAKALPQFEPLRSQPRFRDFVRRLCMEP